MSHGDEWDKKVWVTKSDQNATLFEYANKTMYRKDTPTKEYKLSLPFSVWYANEIHMKKIYFYLNIRVSLRFSIYGQFQGNDHLIYNRSFFYLHKETERIVRHPLINGLPKATRIKRNRVVQNSGKTLSWTIRIFRRIYKIDNEIIYILEISFHCRWTTTIQTPLCSAAKC